MTNNESEKRNEWPARLKACGEWFVAAAQRFPWLGIARELRTKASFWVVVLLAFVATAYYLNGVWMGDPTIGRAGDPERAKFIATLFGGAFSLLLIYVSYRRATAMEKTAKAAQQTADSTDKGNIAERFKTAIEHLGSGMPSVRLGGVYALHHIADENVEYRSRVFDILCAHVRETTTAKGYEPREDPEGRTTILFKPSIEIRTIEDLKDDVQKVRVSPSFEIQAILDLLFVKGASVYARLTADLTGADLQGVNLRNAQLSSAILNEAVLVDCVFNEVDLQNAQLVRTNLQGAFMRSANLQKARLWGADLRGFYAIDVNLEGAKLQRADLCYACLGGNLQNAEFQKANLMKGHLSHAKNLTIEQLRSAQVAPEWVPDYLEKGIEKLKAQEPQLFERESAEEFYLLNRIRRPEQWR